MSTDIMNFLPSEVSRLVLGYLYTQKYVKTYKMFIQECRFLEEYLTLKRKGYSPPLTVYGLNLEQLLEDYATIKSAERQRYNVGTNSLWKQLDFVIDSLKGKTTSKQHQMNGDNQSTRTKRQLCDNRKRLALRNHFRSSKLVKEKPPSPDSNSKSPLHSSPLTLNHSISDDADMTHSDVERVGPESENCEKTVVNADDMEIDVIETDDNQLDSVLVVDSTNFTEVSDVGNNVICVSAKKNVFEVESSKNNSVTDKERTNVPCESGQTSVKRCSPEEDKPVETRNRSGSRKGTGSRTRRRKGKKSGVENNCDGEHTSRRVTRSAKKNLKFADDSSSKENSTKVQSVNEKCPNDSSSSTKQKCFSNDPKENCIQNDEMFGATESNMKDCAEEHSAYPSVELDTCINNKKNLENKILHTSGVVCASIEGQEKQSLNQETKSRDPSVSESPLNYNVDGIQRILNENKNEEKETGSLGLEKKDPQTPKKVLPQSYKDENGKRTPRRKRPPKKKGGAGKHGDRRSSLNQTNENSNDTEEGSRMSSLYDGTIPAFYEQILKNPRLQEKLAENINKQLLSNNQNRCKEEASCSTPRDNGDEVSYTPRRGRAHADADDVLQSGKEVVVSQTVPTAFDKQMSNSLNTDLNDILDLHETRMSESTIAGIVNMTETDPVFESLFNLFAPYSTEINSTEPQHIDFSGITLEMGKDASSNKGKKKTENARVRHSTGRDNTNISMPSFTESLDCPEPSHTSSEENLIMEILQSPQVDSSVSNCVTSPLKLHRPSTENSCSLQAINPSITMVTSQSTNSIAMPNFTSTSLSISSPISTSLSAAWPTTVTSSQTFLRSTTQSSEETKMAIVSPYACKHSFGHSPMSVESQAVSSPHQMIGSPSSQSHRIGQIGCMSQSSRSPLPVDKLRNISENQGILMQPVFNYEVNKDSTTSVVQCENQHLPSEHAECTDSMPKCPTSESNQQMSPSVSKVTHAKDTENTDDIQKYETTVTHSQGLNILSVRELDISKTDPKNGSNIDLPSSLNNSQEGDGQKSITYHSFLDGVQESDHSSTPVNSRTVSDTETSETVSPQEKITGEVMNFLSKLESGLHLKKKGIVSKIQDRPKRGRKRNQDKLPKPKVLKNEWSPDLAALVKITSPEKGSSTVSNTSRVKMSKKFKKCKSETSPSLKPQPNTKDKEKHESCKENLSKENPSLIPEDILSKAVQSMEISPIDNRNSLEETFIPDSQELVFISHNYETISPAKSISRTQNSKENFQDYKHLTPSHSQDIDNTLNCVSLSPSNQVSSLVCSATDEQVDTETVKESPQSETDSPLPKIELFRDKKKKNSVKLSSPESLSEVSSPGKESDNVCNDNGSSDFSFKENKQIHAPNVISSIRSSLIHRINSSVLDRQNQSNKEENMEKTTVTPKHVHFNVEDSLHSNDSHSLETPTTTSNQILSMPTLEALSPNSSCATSNHVTSQEKLNVSGTPVSVSVLDSQQTYQEPRQASSVTLAKESLQTVNEGRVESSSHGSDRDYSKMIYSENQDFLELDSPGSTMDCDSPLPNMHPPPETFFTPPLQLLAKSAAVQSPLPVVNQPTHFVSYASDNTSVTNLIDVHLSSPPYAPLNVCNTQNTSNTDMNMSSSGSVPLNAFLTNVGTVGGSIQSLNGLQTQQIIVLPPQLNMGNVTLNANSSQVHQQFQSYTSTMEMPKQNDVQLAEGNPAQSFNLTGKVRQILAQHNTRAKKTGNKLIAVPVGVHVSKALSVRSLNFGPEAITSTAGIRQVGCGRGRKKSIETKKPKNKGRQTTKQKKENFKHVNRIGDSLLNKSSKATIELCEQNKSEQTKFEDCEQCIPDQNGSVYLEQGKVQTSNLPSFIPFSTDSVVLRPPLEESSKKYKNVKNHVKSNAVVDIGASKNGSHTSLNSVFDEQICKKAEKNIVARVKHYPIDSDPKKTTFSSVDSNVDVNRDTNSKKLNPMINVQYPELDNVTENEDSDVDVDGEWECSLKTPVPSHSVEKETAANMKQETGIDYNDYRDKRLTLEKTQNVSVKGNFKACSTSFVGDNSHTFKQEDSRAASTSKAVHNGSHNNSLLNILSNYGDCSEDSDSVDEQIPIILAQQKNKNKIYSSRSVYDDQSGPNSVKSDSSQGCDTVLVDNINNEVNKQIQFKGHGSESYCVRHVEKSGLSSVNCKQNHTARPGSVKSCGQSPVGSPQSSQDSNKTLGRFNIMMTPPKKRITATLKNGDGSYYYFSTSNHKQTSPAGLSPVKQECDNNGTSASLKSQGGKTPKKHNQIRRSSRLSGSPVKGTRGQQATLTKSSPLKGYKTGNVSGKKRQRDDTTEPSERKYKKTKPDKKTVDLKKIDFDKFLNKLHKK